MLFNVSIFIPFFFETFETFGMSSVCVCTVDRVCIYMCCLLSVCVCILYVWQLSTNEKQIVKSDWMRSRCVDCVLHRRNGAHLMDLHRIFVAIMVTTNLRKFNAKIQLRFSEKKITFYCIFILIGITYVHNGRRSTVSTIHIYDVQMSIAKHCFYF